MKPCTFLVGVVFGLACAAPHRRGYAVPPPANSEQVVDLSFDSDSLGNQWHITTGKWESKDGVLRASEIEAEKHSAAGRFKVSTKNAVYQFRFRLVGDATSFHFGFDPAPGQLEKKGHLFSVIVTPENWKIMKHVDKSCPKEDPNEILAQSKRTFQRDRWYQMRVTTWGSYVTAVVDDETTLRADHPTFGVAKPTLVFRCLGDGIELDDIKVWKQKAH